MMLSRGSQFLLTMSKIRWLHTPASTYDFGLGQPASNSLYSSSTGGDMDVARSTWLSLDGFFDLCCSTVERTLFICSCVTSVSTRASVAFVVDDGSALVSVWMIIPVRASAVVGSSA